jgi:hypothetical protein
MDEKMFPAGSMKASLLQRIHAEGRMERARGWAIWGGGWGAIPGFVNSDTRPADAEQQMMNATRDLRVSV